MECTYSRAAPSDRPHCNTGTAAVLREVLLCHGAPSKTRNKGATPAPSPDRPRAAPRSAAARLRLAQAGASVPGAVGSSERPPKPVGQGRLPHHTIQILGRSPRAHAAPRSAAARLRPAQAGASVPGAAQSARQTGLLLLDTDLAFYSLLRARAAQCTTTVATRDPRCVVSADPSTLLRTDPPAVLGTTINHQIQT
jgi:hypothetical protein